MKAKQNSSSVSFGYRVKEFLHPSSVTWKSPKNTTHDSLVVLSVVVAAAVFLAVGDIVFGTVLGLLL